MGWGRERKDPQCPGTDSAGLIENMPQVLAGWLASFLS